MIEKQYYCNAGVQDMSNRQFSNQMIIDEHINDEMLEQIDRNMNKYLEQRRQQNEVEGFEDDQQQIEQYMEQSQQQNRSIASDMNYYSDLKRFFMQKTNNKMSSGMSSIKELELSNHDNKIQMETINEEITNENVISAAFQSELQQHSLNEDSVIIYQYFRQNRGQKQYLSQAMEQAGPELKAQIFLQALNLMSVGKIEMKQEDQMNFSEIEVRIN